jgi:tetratricopeptide (TPR) repeat protein
MSENFKEYLDNGIFEIQSGHYQDGISKINKSLEIKNDWEIPYFYRAVANQALKNWDEAILDYTKSIQLNAKMTDAYYNRARIMLVRKDIEKPDYNKAIQDLECALKLDENFVDALYAMAAAYKKIAQYSKALEFLDRLLIIEPQAVNARALKKLLLQKYIK